MLNQDRYIKLGLFSLIIGHLIAAYFSFGYHHPDEHYQILEWAHYFVGLAPNPAHLRWEFASQIRPWFQPLLHAFFMKASIWMGIYNPFDLAFFFRLSYAALNIWSLVALWNYFQKKYELSSKWFLMTSLLWFFPYVHVRTSSENLSGIFLSFALLMLLKNESSLRAFFQAGLLFGFAFLARYQIALGLLGLGIVLLISDHGFRKKHGLLILGFCLPIGLGVLLDRWGYGNWVFTPYRYFKVNILEHVAASFNPYPWYQYLIWIAQLNPLISLPLFYGVIRFSFKSRLNVISGFVMSFFILHFFITNKEYRFLFPILNVAPFMAIAYFHHVNQTQFPESFFKRIFWAPAFLIFYLVLNLASFGASSLHGASTRTLWPTHAINQFYDKYHLSVWLTNRDYLVNDDVKYYNLNDISDFKPHEMHLYHSETELVELLKKNPQANVMIDGDLKDPLTQSFVKTMETMNCQLLTSAFPKIISERTKLSFQALYSCQKN